MTTPTGLELVWANAGGTTDPGNAKYQLGWVAEIPTFQNFNHVLQALDKAKLSYAEADVYPWQDLIAYAVGAKVERADIRYTCITAHNDSAGTDPQDPTLDTTNSYWATGILLSAEANAVLSQEEGLKLDRINKRTSKTVWQGNDTTLNNETAVLALNTPTVADDNFLFANVQGKIVVVNVGNKTIPDGTTSLLPAVNTNAHYVFHEGNQPDVSQVTNALVKNPEDGVLYGRRDGNWVKVTSTTISTAPPPPIEGDGSMWYNLDDGTTYVDINDGDSSQWVPSSPPVVTKGIIDDLSQAHDVKTLLEMSAITDILPAGKVVNVTDLEATYTVLSGVGTVNGYDIRASDTLDQSYDLVVTDKLPLSHIGCSPSVNDNSPAINHAFANFKTINVDGDYEIENPVTLTGAGKCLYSISKGRIYSQANINLLLIDDCYTPWISRVILENEFVENSSTAILTPSGKFMSNGTIDGVIIRGTAQGISVLGKDNSFNDFNFTQTNPDVGGGTTYTQTITRSGKTDTKNLIMNCLIENTLKSTKLGSGGNPGIYLHGAFNIVHNNRIRNWLGPGILGGGDSIISNNTVINMIQENGIYAASGSRLTITGNHIENFAADGIGFNNAEDVTVTGNYIGGGGNGCIRLQDGCERITIQGNTFQVTGSHWLRIPITAGYDAPKDIQVSGNTVKCVGQAVGNLISAESTTGGKFKNINIHHNTITGYDGSLLAGGFNNYYLVNFRGVSLAESAEISFTDNNVEMVDIPSDVSGRMATLFGVNTNNNKFVFSGGDIYDGRVKSGQDRFALGGSGAVQSENKTGLISSIVKDVAAGEYVINTTETIKIDSFNWTASGANAPFFIRKNVANPASTASYGNSFVMTMYNVAGSPVNPAYNASLEVNVTRQNEPKYV